MSSGLNLPKADPSDIEALFPNGKPKWASNTITYNFMPSLPISYIGAPILETLRQDASGVSGKDFKPFNQAQKLAAEAALKIWADAANITFQRKEDKALQLADFITPAPIKFILNAVGAYDDFADAIDDIAGKYIGFPVVEGADIRFGTDDQGAESAGYAYYPASNLLENIEEAKNNFFDAVDSLIKPINDAIDALNDLILLPIDLIPNLPTASKLFPFATLKLGRYGDLFLNNTSDTNQPDKIGVAGSYGFETLLHEIGHTLGLEHPGNYNAGGGGTDAPYLTGEKDSKRYTVMSYNSPFGTVSPETPMLYDIAAIQQLYGANFNTRSGDTVYRWDKPFVATIWDGGGNDTIDASNWSNVTIDLNEGEFSSIGLDANLAIAFGVTIENAIGGTGDDILIGNQVSNRLEGGASADTLTGGAGADVLIGGAGSDTAAYTNSPQGVTINLLTGQGFGGDATGDTLQSIENLEGSAFSDTFIANLDPNQLDGIGGVDTVSYVQSSAGVNVNLSAGLGSGGFASGDLLISIENIEGSDFDDTLVGDGKINVLNGRGGDDTIFAGAGNNWINAGTGNNTIYSGNDQDLFILSVGAGLDTIKNFEVGKDKLGLTDGLQVDQLLISQINSGGFFGTQIGVRGSDEILARLEFTQSSQLNSTSFRADLPSDNSSLLSLFG
jgi:Ca2+-binding RTX toxin-like protein